MIIVSGLRAGLVIGLSVTPSKIQHDGSRWNRKFGSGGSSMLVGSADSHTSPTSCSTSALVIPPIRKSATCAGVGRLDPLPGPLRRGDPDLTLVEDVVADPVLRVRPDQRLGQQPLGLEHLDAAFAHHLAEHVVLGLGLLDPQHVVEQQLLGVRGVSRVCSRPGRCTMTLRSLPTSECIPAACSSPSLLGGPLMSPMRNLW